MSKKCKKSKKSQKSKKHDVYEDEGNAAAFVVVLVIIAVLLAIAGVNYRGRQNDVDASVQANVQEAVRGMNEWTSSYPSTEVPMKVVAATIDGHQTVHSPLSTDPNEFSRWSVPVSADPGNTLMIRPGVSDGSYTICGFSEGGNHAISQSSAVVYDSTTGETKLGVPCP